MLFGTAASQPTSVFCTQCGKRLPSSGRFCPQCGASFLAGNQQPLSNPSIASLQDGIAALENAAAEHPEDASYRRLLAIALHDDAIKDWWQDPKDHELLCVSHAGVAHARLRLVQAQSLQFDDPALRETIAKMLDLVSFMERREFAGSWLMVIVLGLFYIFPGVLWWYVNRRPRYLINHDYMMHTKTGKTSRGSAKMGGIQGAVYDFFSGLSEDWGWLIGLIFMMTIGVVLSPIFMVLAYKQNYFDVKKTSTAGVDL